MALGQELSSLQVTLPHQSNYALRPQQLSLSPVKPEELLNGVQGVNNTFKAIHHLHGTRWHTSVVLLLCQGGSADCFCILKSCSLCHIVRCSWSCQDYQVQKTIRMAFCSLTCRSRVEIELQPGVMSALAYKNTPVTQPRDPKNCSHQLHEETTQPAAQRN